MPLSVTDDSVKKRSETLWRQQELQSDIATHRIFAVLLGLQWIGCFAATIALSPYTWDGPDRSVHIHVWMTALAGAALTLFPWYMMARRPGAALTRHVVAVAQMLWSALLIHISDGRIETHFHIFGSLAYLAFYQDWKVLLTATVTVTLDHSLRGSLWPQSVFGSLSVSQYRWLEHISWVLFEDALLIAACVRGQRKMREVAMRQAQMEHVVSNTESEVSRRTAELHESQRKAEASSHAKSEFLANMSHEIRTPLTAIQGFADLLGEEYTSSISPQDRQSHIHTIRHACDHLLTVINDILDISKIEAGKMAVEVVETPLLSIIADVGELNRMPATRKGLNLEVRLDTPLPDRIESDPTRLRQILMNLVSNAIKFTKKGSVTIAARRELRREKEILVITVEDTGVGLTDEQRTHLFDAFTQADSSVTRNFGGSGLGLNICKRLASFMGGDVKLESSCYGSGSCFAMELPLITTPGAHLTSSLEFAAATDSKSMKPLDRLSGRILLAEDGADNQRLISFVLRKAGAEVDIANDGKIALQMLHDANDADMPYALLLTDIQMPTMDGYTLTRTLRNQGNRIPIIALTAHAMVENLQQCLDAGCDAVATKPINRADLLKSCAEWMSSPRSNVSLMTELDRQASSATHDQTLVGQALA